jgi:rfaE bifunctional protein nucleotidyltransferase chain/domain
MGVVLTQTELLSVVAALPPQTVTVATNGCFDLLHVGHLRYLQAARSLGDCLIVAVNSDRSVAELKGPTRPIVPEDERAELLAGLACVDYVTLFDEQSPVDLLVALRPKRYVKGAQYTEDTLPEAPALKAVGTELMWAPMVAGRSTTDVIARVRQLA